MPRAVKALTSSYDSSNVTPDTRAHDPSLSKHTSGSSCCPPAKWIGGHGKQNTLVASFRCTYRVENRHNMSTNRSIEVGVIYHTGQLADDDAKSSRFGELSPMRATGALYFCVGLRKGVGVGDKVMSLTTSAHALLSLRCDKCHELSGCEGTSTIERLLG